MKYLFMGILFFAVFLACDLDALYNSGEEEVRESPRDRRVPNDDEPEPPVTPTLYFPSTVGTTWTYDVVYSQESRQANEYRAVYKGEETWELTTARFSDSTFVFRNWFSGLKIVSDVNSSQTIPVHSSYASVTAQIRNKALVIVQERGDELCPFWGDWLFLMNSYFMVCFQNSEETVQLSKSMTNLEYSYTLDRNRGLVQGNLNSKSEYDLFSLSYTLK